MNQVVTRLQMPSDLTEMDVGKWRVLCEAVFPSAKTPEAIVMAIDYCKARNLDIFKKPVNIVPMWNSTLGKNVETIWPGINEIQVTAARTGQYAGMDMPVWGGEKTRTFAGIKKWKDGNIWKEENLKIELTYPESCAVTVYRMISGVRCAFTEPVFWEEAYARQGKTEVPNDMWSKRPKGQILKVAKAFSLRAAFPEEGEYTAEEMEGLETKAGGIVIDITPSSAITPSEIDPSKPKSPFGNASARNTFHKNTCVSYHNARNPMELESIRALNADKFKAMAESGAEADQLSLDEMDKQYTIALNRMSAEKEDEIPSYIREMDEQFKNAVG